MKTASKPRRWLFIAVFVVAAVGLFIYLRVRPVVLAESHSPHFAGGYIRIVETPTSWPEAILFRYNPFLPLRVLLARQLPLVGCELFRRELQRKEGFYQLELGFHGNRVSRRLFLLRAERTFMARNQMTPNRVPGVVSSRVPHHPAYGSRTGRFRLDSGLLAPRETRPSGTASRGRRRHESRLRAPMLLTAPALTLASPAGVISLRIRRGIVALPYRFGPSRHRVLMLRRPGYAPFGSRFAESVFAASAAGSAPVSCLSGRFPAPGSLRITTASADSLCWLPGKGSPQVRTRCFATQPPHLPPRLNRRTSLCGAGSSHRVGLLMRFLFIGSSLSHSVACVGWDRNQACCLSSFGSFPRSVTLPELASGSDLFHVFMFRFLTGDFHPICNAPMLGAHPAVHRTVLSRQRRTESLVLGGSARPVTYRSR
jgi:hypothetical protein